MLETIISNLVSIIIGFGAAILGVVLATRYGRRRAKAEKLYDIKRDAYAEIAWKLNLEHDLVREMGLLSSADISEASKDPFTFLREVAASAPIDSRKLWQEMNKDLDMVLSAQTDDERIKHFSIAIGLILEESSLRATRLYGEIEQRIRMLRLVGLPVDVFDGILEVSELLLDHIGRCPRLIQGTDPRVSGFQEVTEEWSSQVQLAIERMEQTMEKDLDHTL